MKVGLCIQLSAKLSESKQVIPKQTNFFEMRKKSFVEKKKEKEGLPSRWCNLEMTVSLICILNI